MFGKFQIDPVKVKSTLNRGVDQIAKTTKTLEEKDLKEFKVNLTVGDYDEKKNGLSVTAAFGITDARVSRLAGI